MKFSISRDLLLKPLQQVAAVVERRKTLSILSNVLVELSTKTLTLTATDLEVEIKAIIPMNSVEEEGVISIPGRKLYDIVRSLDANATLLFQFKDGQMSISSERSRFTLSTLYTEEFPTFEGAASHSELSLAAQEIRYLIERTSFSMAQQDVRYFLNGLLVDVDTNKITTVAADGHRMAVSSITMAQENELPHKQVIIPRRGVLELLRLLNDSKNSVDISISDSHIRFSFDSYVYTSKIIDGQFPDYRRVLPNTGDKIIKVSRESLKQSLTRAAILSNEQYRGIRLQLRTNLLRVIASNPEHEEAEDELEIDYQGADLNIGVNVSYILDILSNVNAEMFKFTFNKTDTAILVEIVDDPDSFYVIMPMHL